MGKKSKVLKIFDKQKINYSKYWWIIGCVVVIIGIVLAASNWKEDDLAGKATSQEVYDKCIKDCDANKKKLLALQQHLKT